MSEEGVKDYVGFLIDQESYCINVDIIQEIIPVPHITLIPYSSPSSKKTLNAINLGGEIIELIDVRVILGIPEKKMDQKTRIIIIRSTDKIFGILVDELLKFFSISATSVCSVPEIFQLIPELSYLKGILFLREKVVLEINPLMLGDENDHEYTKQQF